MKRLTLKQKRFSQEYVRNGGNANIISRKIARDASLPDDLQIATVPSKIVRRMVVETMQEFYDN